MYYEINVAKNGRHFFATDKRSLTTEAEAQEVYNTISEKFKKDEGYDISVSYHPQVGYGETAEFEERYQKELVKSEEKRKSHI